MSERKLQDTRLEIVCSSDLRRALKEVAAREEESAASIVRRALREYLGSRQIASASVNEFRCAEEMAR